MKVVHIASELSPIAKIGGLADVLQGLSTASADAGLKVSIIIPAYDHVKKDFLKDCDYTVLKIDGILTCHVYKKKLKKTTVYCLDLIEPIFERTGIYGGASEHEFFLFFSKAAAHLTIELKPEVCHGHDWQASFSIFELKKQKSSIKSILTLHNLQYQGKVPQDLLIKMGLSYPLAPWMFDPCDSGLINLLKMGIESADRITTVSKSYHTEILEGHNAFHLDKTLIAHRHKFLGILNGIDYDYFNPIHDKYLAFQFPKKCFSDQLSLEEAKKRNLQAICELHSKPFDERFTVCSITRLAEQKAPHLILYTLKKTIELGGRFILVGSLHGSPLDEQIIHFLKEYENHPYVIAELNTNAQMAHLTYAGSHALIVPSLFEPCGLTQMIAMRYGTIAMVRSTGGLKDTVFDVDTSDLDEQERNGFTFDYPDEGGIDWVLTRAFKLYSETPELFYSLAHKNLSQDHSWRKAVEGYLELYAILGLNSKN